MNADTNNRKSLEQERQELNTLVGKGVSFEVKDTQLITRRRLFGLVRKHERKEVTRKFTIEEPTLATLDRLSSEWIEFAIDEESIKTDDGLKRARSLTREHAIRCARVIAIAVLGESRLVPSPCKGGTRWVEDTRAVKELTDLFARKIKPSRLYQLYLMITAMCNLGDFLNSIRLMSMERTTMPIRIEENGRG